MPAQAGNIQYTALNGEIGFDFAGSKPLSSASTFSVPIVKGITAYFRRSAPSTYFGAQIRRVSVEGLVGSNVISAGGGFAFRVKNAAAGQKWSKFQTNLSHHSSLADALFVGRRTSGGSVNALSGQNGTFYKLFAYQQSSMGPIDFGWIELDQTLTATDGPDLKILGMAIDTTPGELIAAGNTGQPVSATPEPSTAALASLAALALGASGLRRWRAARKQTA
jgi:hypothetical protein